MKAAFNAKLAMARTCRDTINHPDYQEIVQAGPKAFTTAAEELADLIDEITQTAQTQESSKTAASADRNEALRLLGDCAFDLVSSLHAWSVANDSNDLAVRTDFSRTSITRGSSTAVLNRCRDVQQWVREHLDSLTDYKVTQADLTTLKNRIKAFEEVQTKPRTTKAVGRAATRQLEAQFARLDNLITGQLDRLAVKFKGTAPGFYEAYRASRSIVQPAVAMAANVMSAPNTVPDTKAA